MKKYYAIPQATVTRISDGQVFVRVRRSHREERIVGVTAELCVGDKIVTGRRTNDPYLNFVSIK